MYFKKGMYLPLTEQLKTVVNVPVMVAGRMDNPDMTIKALEDGKLDAVGLGGELVIGGVPSFKEDDLALIKIWSQKIKE